eukprot:5581183-Heterocapsa_arctica.AAC.1
MLFRCLRAIGGGWTEMLHVDPLLADLAGVGGSEGPSRYPLVPPVSASRRYPEALCHAVPGCSAPC